MRAKRYTSEELLRLYQAGERNFRKVNLWNQSFKAQDLSGIDFEGADIQGADFTNAILKGANFRSVIGGLKGNPTLRKTSFRNADLTDADCTLARFERTDFTGAIFNRECWQQAKKLVVYAIHHLSSPSQNTVAQSGLGAVFIVAGY
jgi:uncharacterized protein YjbI with pentapeptide repeats